MQLAVLLAVQLAVLLAVQLAVQLAVLFPDRTASVLSLSPLLFEQKSRMLFILC